ncbi:MAG: hypothetical protein ACFCU3_06195, partial [Verrucomicrobiales bacterium]
MSEQFAALSDIFARKRDKILKAWRAMDRNKPGHTTGSALTLSQFLDHIPAILDAYELRLRSKAGGTHAKTAEANQKEEGIKHGLHRWQQGYHLTELICECGDFQICVFEELANIGSSHPELEHRTLLEAHRQLIHLINSII